MPTCAVPTCAVPTWAVPTCAVPTWAVPTWAVPTWAVPTCAVPTWAVPTCAVPRSRLHNARWSSSVLDWSSSPRRALRHDRRDGAAVDADRTATRGHDGRDDTPAVSAGAGCHAVTER